jgi:hypothetical protein
MKRQLIGLILMLVVTFQGSLVAFAGAAAPMSSDCEKLTVSVSSQHDCCPSAVHTANCCQDTCPATTAAVSTSAAPLLLQGRQDGSFPFHSESFSSRGESPLTRPPIL